MFTEIDNFQGFGAQHLIALFIPIVIGTLFIIQGLKTTDEKQRKNQRIALALLIIAIRSVRYGMDIYYGRFDVFDLFSLQVCHIDLILLVICLIRPNPVLFSFNFMIGIPMGLAVALLPGRVHPIPGTPRAMFFIMSHMMLVVAAIYLAVAEKQNVRLKLYAIFAGTGCAAMFLVYFINLGLGTNFLYIMEAPEGTLIESLDRIFGWPGYAVAMAVLAVSLMFVMYLISRLINQIIKAGDTRFKMIPAIEKNMT
ncbi:MAG: TMEM164-related integral membrane acyltransferase [Saccharofermentanales bacterium]